MIIDISRYILLLFVFQSRTCPFLGFQLHIVSFCFALCVVMVLNFQAFQSEACISLQSMSICYCSGSSVEMIFRLFSL